MYDLMDLSEMAASLDSMPREEGRILPLLGFLPIRYDL
jgi:hypothetical protein